LSMYREELAATVSSSREHIGVEPALVRARFLKHVAVP